MSSERASPQEAPDSLDSRVIRLLEKCQPSDASATLLNEADRKDDGHQKHHKMLALFDRMRKAYAHYATELEEPIRDKFNRDCMEWVLETTERLVDEDQLAWQIRVSTEYAERSRRRGVFTPTTPSAKPVKLNERLREVLEPIIHKAVETIFNEMCVWTAGLSFKDSRSVMWFLDTFERQVHMQPHLHGIQWPGEIFASFRVDFLMRKDFRIKFSTLYHMNEEQRGRKLPFPHFSANFEIDTLHSITHIDDAEAMTKWLRISPSWLSKETDGCSLMEVLDKCVMQFSAKCLLAISKELFEKHFFLNEWTRSVTYDCPFQTLLQASLSNPLGGDTVMFGYSGPIRWQKMTPAFLRACYRHPLILSSDRSVLSTDLKPVPVGAPLRSMWVSLVRWGPVSHTHLTRPTTPYV